MFIVFEWVDGSGKDTQLNKVFAYLTEQNKNLQIWRTKEPTAYTDAGRVILQKLSNWGFENPQEALQLYIQDRIEQSQLRREILNHSCILSSRFDYSTYAYQWAGWISFEEIYKAHWYQENNILIPDLSFIFVVERQTIEARLAKRGTEKEFFEDLDFLGSVNTQYYEVAKKLQDKWRSGIHIIDANGGIEDVFRQVVKGIELYIKEKAVL